MSEQADPKDSGEAPAGFQEDPASADPEMEPLLEGLGLRACKTCGRNMDPEEKWYVRTVRTCWAGEDGAARRGRTHREARCTDCGPHHPDDIPGEEAALVEP